MITLLGERFRTYNVFKLFGLKKYNGSFMHTGYIANTWKYLKGNKEQKK